MLDKKAEAVLNQSVRLAASKGHAQTYPEHVLYFVLQQAEIKQIIDNFDVDQAQLLKEVKEYLDQIPSDRFFGGRSDSSEDFNFLIKTAFVYAQTAKKPEISILEIFAAFFSLDRDSQARYLLSKNNVNKGEVLRLIAHGDEDVAEEMAEAGGEPEGERKIQKLDFLINLNERAKEKHIDPLIGRHGEVERVMQTLVRRKKNNPLLVGEAGVGKTAIAEGLALKIARGEVPKKLANCIVYSLDLGSMLAGTKFRGDFEQKMKSLLKLLKKNPQAILFIDEIHTIVGAGAAGQGGTDAANMLKPMLANGELRVIGATTYKEFRQVFEKDPALARRFQKVDVVEPSPEDTIRILTGVKDQFETHHDVVITPEAIRTAVELSVKHINDRFLPDKAIDLLDEAGAMLSLREEGKDVTPTVIEKLVAKIARIPEKTVSTSQKDKLKNLEIDIKRLIFGQDQAVEQTVSQIQLAQSGLRGGEKPIGSFLFLGPTGVGKTELAKQLAFNLGIHFERLDMSEYHDKHTSARLIGAPPGYVGYDQEGLLTGAVMKHPHSVILLDEIEKAHPDVWNLLLQIMDHGTLTDSSGRKADFKNTIIIMTSNVGAAEASRRTMGIGAESSVAYQKPTAAVERTFTPEFRNRLDGIIFFQPLTREHVTAVLDKYLAELDMQLAPKGVSVELSPAAKDFLMQEGYQPALGARPMQRVVQERLKRELAKELLFGALEHGGDVKVDLVGGQLKFLYAPQKAKKKKKPESSEAKSE